MVKVLTFNIWFDLKARRVRTAALLTLLQQQPADVICLQEVVPDVARELIGGLPGWTCSDPGDGSSLRSYGVMTLVAPGMDARFSFFNLPTSMERRLLVTYLPNLTVGNVHLESLANHPVREKQLKICADKLREHDNALLVGDFNFDSERNYTAPHVPLENDCLKRHLPDFVDTWPALRPTERGLTFNSAANPFHIRSEQFRFDRIMCRLPNWRPVDIELVGQYPVDHLVEVTAHEREQLLRPLTPPRPVLVRHRAPKMDAEDLFLDLDGDAVPRLLPLAAPGMAAPGVPSPGSPMPRTKPPLSGDEDAAEMLVTPPETPPRPTAALQPEAADPGFATPATPETPSGTPPRLRGKLFLSDHFGLLATFEPPGSVAATTVAEAIAAASAGA